MRRFLHFRGYNSGFKINLALKTILARLADPQFCKIEIQAKIFPEQNF
jgi:hypothetical protein